MAAKKKKPGARYGKRTSKVGFGKAQTYELARMVRQIRKSGKVKYAMKSAPGLKGASPGYKDLKRVGTTASENEALRLKGLVTAKGNLTAKGKKLASKGGG